MMTSNNSSSTISSATEERLNSLLAASDFSVASYLDTALQDEGDNLQRKMAELALQIQLQTQACHEDIGRIGAELQAVLPRCATDISRVGVGLEGIRIDASQLLQECLQLQNEEISSSLETLSTLHALRSNLKHTQDILKAAATWDSTLQSIPPLLAQQNLPQAVNALALLESGERALRGMPSGLEERRQALNDMRTQVQHLLQPQLKHALQNMHTRLAPLQQCVSLYSALKKMDILQSEYVSNRPAQIHKQWFAFRASGVDQESLVSWLPTWYDAVLTLLTEERRQSLAVYGPDLAPIIIDKVLRECFRPIIGSFQTRLDTFLSPVTGRSMTGNGSLEAICGLYEATLQFLSLAYETVAGGWHDVADATSVEGSQLYKDIAETFVQIASPFAPYQKSLAQLETFHSNVAQTLIKKDIHQAVNSKASPTVAHLQDTTERLLQLAPYVFPLAQASMARLELLTGGYQVRSCLSVIDTLLAHHAQELALSIQTINTNAVAEMFDDQHVSVALEMLKVVGCYQNSLNDFGLKTRERMSVLQQRRVSQDLQEKEVSTKSKAFLLPDALSVVEIDSLLCKSVLYQEEEDEEALGRLASSDSVLFPNANDSVERLKRSCQGLVFQVCSAVPRKHLEDMSSMPCWTSQSTDMSSYGTLPQAYITQVGEHMLALVQALDPFASSEESLAMATQVMGGVCSVAVQPWRDLLAAVGASEDIVDTLMRGTELKEYVHAYEEEQLLEEEVEHQDFAEKSKHDFCNQWLDAVSLAVTGRLLERIMRIPRLSTKGCEHLSVDLNYLANVLAALGVTGHPHPLVKHMADMASVDGESLRAMVQRRGRSTPLVAALCAMEERFTLMRGEHNQQTN